MDKPRSIRGRENLPFMCRAPVSHSQKRPGEAHSCLARTNRDKGLQRAQEVQDVLPLAGSQQLVEDQLGLRRFRAVALVGFDGGQQVSGAAIVQEKDALTQTPQRSRAELIAAGIALGNVVSQTDTHVMDFYVGEQVGSSVAQTKRQLRGLGGERWRMAKGAADGVKEPTTISDRGCSSRE